MEAKLISWKSTDASLNLQGERTLNFLDECSNHSTNSSDTEILCHSYSLLPKQHGNSKVQGVQLYQQVFLTLRESILD